MKIKRTSLLIALFIYCLSVQAAHKPLSQTYYVQNSQDNETVVYNKQVVKQDEPLQVRYVQKPKRHLVEKLYYEQDGCENELCPYYGYYRGPSWRRWGYYGYPYGYWPSFGTGFGFGGRRGDFSFGFGW